MKKPPPPEALLDYVLIDSQRLQGRIAELAQAINADYAAAGRPLLLVGILKGSLQFMVDLMRQISVPHIVDFLDVTSYGAGVRESSRNVRILMDLHISIEGMDVLIVEDIIDSGHTLKEVLSMLSTRSPASLNVCTLLNKAERREVDIPLRYVGFEIPNAFVFGYGLDIDEYYRNLPYIGVVKPGINLE